MEKICLIIQGPSNNVNIIKEKYKNTNIQIIFSTWIGEESKYNENDIVIFNKMRQLKRYSKCYVTTISTYNGLIKAKN